MNRQELMELKGKLQKLGFLPLAKIVKGYAPKIKYTFTFRKTLKKAIPEADLKIIQISEHKTNRLIFFKATPENLATIKKLCEEAVRKEGIAKKFLTSQALAKKLKKQYGLRFSPDTLARRAEKGAIPSVKNDQKRYFNPRD